MANKDNFKSNIQELSREYKKFTVSRVFDTMENPLLEMEIPADLYDNNEKVNIELNLYSLADNSLVYSDVIRDAQTNDAITVQTYQYKDLTVRKLVFIDFSKVSNTFIPSGRFSVTLNFFIDELGSSEDKLLTIKRISPSRKEVEFTFDSSRRQEVENFVSYRLPKEIIFDILAQICNQPNSAELEIPVLNNTTNSGSISAQFSVTMNQTIQKYEFDVDKNNNNYLSVYTIAQNILDKVYTNVSTVLTREIANGRTWFYSQYLLKLVHDEVRALYADEQKKQYRFALI